jgi:hypothetical protein
MTYGNGQGEPKGKEPVDWVVDLFVHTPIGLAVMAWKRMPEFVSSVPDLLGQAVAKGCAQLAGAEERLSEEVRKARMIGQVAVTFGGRQLRREVDARLRDARQAAGGVASFLPGGGGGPNGAGAAGAPTVSARATPTAPSSPSAAAPKPSGAKAAAAKAATKPAAARTSATKAAGTQKATKASTAKKASGATKRARRTAAAASAADLPIREYDGLSASQVVSRLSGLTPEELRAIRSYEEGSRGRRTVLVAIDRLLA